ncbi:MAG TPA: hypothetical protein VF328_13065, partial [Mycobacterium sp.]
LTGGVATLDSGDIEALCRLVTVKGYGIQVGSQLIILANPGRSDTELARRRNQRQRDEGQVRLACSR